MTATKAFSLSITPQVILIHINPRALIRGSGHTLLFSLSMKKKSWLFSAIVILEKDYQLIVAEIGKELWIAAVCRGSSRRWKSISNLSILKTCFIWVSAKNQKRISDWHATSLTASLASTMLSLSSGGGGGIFEVRSHMAKSEMKIKFIRKMYEDWFVK